MTAWLTSVSAEAAVSALDAEPVVAPAGADALGVDDELDAAAGLVVLLPLPQAASARIDVTVTAGSAITRSLFMVSSPDPG